MAEGHLGGEDSLPDLPRRKLLTEQPLLSRSRQHTLSAPGASLYDTKSPGSSRCSSPRLKRSLELVRISRNEWEQRERALSSLRADKNELSSISRQQSDLDKHHQQLQKACLQLAHILGCTATNEINGETVTRVVHPKAVQLTIDASASKKQVSTLSEDLAKARGELSSNTVKLSSSEANVHQLMATLSSKEAETQQLKNEVGQLKQSEVHSRTMLQALEEQIKLLEDKKSSETSNQCERQNEITTLKQQLGEKNNEIASLRDEVGTLQLEKTEMQERCLVSDAAYEEICIQLADILQVDQSESCDFEKLLMKVISLMEQYDEQRLKIESLGQLNQVTELDSKANRETILRLVADLKKHEEQSVDSTQLQKKISELKDSYEKARKDSISLSERLTASHSSVVALQQELKSKERSQEQMRREIEVLRSQNKKDEVETAVKPYSDLCEQLRETLKCSSDQLILYSLHQLIKDKHELEKQLMESERINRGTSNKLRLANEQLKDTEDDLETQRTKLIDMNQSVETCEMLHSKVQELNDKHEKFLKRLIERLKVESGSILVGDFAEDAVLVRIEQLSKHESQAVLEKQTAFYSIQRKLKSCRQQLEAKDLQLGLSQRKVMALEARLSEMSHKEIEWNATIERGKRVERQLERLQEKIMKQQEIIGTLKIDSEHLERLKVDSQRRDEKMAKTEEQLENLQQNKIYLSQQLADARHRVQSIASQDKERAERAEQQLKQTRKDVETIAKDKEELVEFKDAVRRLISTAQFDESELAGSDSMQDRSGEYDVLIQIEKLIISCNRYCEMSKSLQASLKQLEAGFKRGYQDTLTLLNTN